MADKIALYVNDVLVYSQGGTTTNPPPVTPPPPPPPPPPTGNPALDEFDRRAQLGQWAAWKFWDAAAFGGLMARGHTFERITSQVQWYNHDFVIPGNNAGGVYRYFNRHVGNFVQDVGGSADAYVAAEAAAQGRGVPSPVR
jgi:hypothetical protein